MNNNFTTKMFISNKTALDKESFINNNVIKYHFIKEGKKLETGPVCALSLRCAGSMRFRWNEVNNNRNSFFSFIIRNTKSKITPFKILPVELIHSKIVYAAEKTSDISLKQGDGIITTRKNYIPVITVADCMPVFIYDPVTEVFGVLHSGWKGTGIVANAIKLAEKKYNSRPENFCVILGPHIRNCCYIVNKERADYFIENFTPECITKLNSEEYSKVMAAGSWNIDAKSLYYLSLERANFAVLEKSGVLSANILSTGECTCCDERFGSFRRETADLSKSISIEEKWKHFTVQAAFCGYFD